MDAEGTITETQSVESNRGRRPRECREHILEETNLFPTNLDAQSAPERWKP